MKWYIYIILVFLLTNCQKNIIRIHSTAPQTLEKQGLHCKELTDFVEKNMFYIKSTNSYITNYMFFSILRNRYLDCINSLSIEEAILIFGSPTCQTENQVCYYLHFILPENITYEEIRLDPNSLSITITQKGDKLILGGKCNCEK